MGGDPKQVYLLWHSHAGEADDEDAKLLGVYSSEERATGRIARSVELPGFRDAPDGFKIVAVGLDRDEWREGYHQVDGIDLPAWFRPYG